MAFKGFLSKAKDIDILASLPDGVILVDNEGKIDWINEAGVILLKLSKNDIFKRSLNEIIESGLDIAKQAAEINKSVVGRARTLEGRDFYLEITSKMASNYFIISIRDVTQSYKTVTSILVEHESSKKINKDKNAFLVKLSNELKSPLHSILGFSQAMIDGLGGEMSDKQEKYIKIINKNSSEALYLMDKIIELSKTESNLLEYDYQIFDVVNSIQNVVKNYEQIINEKNLSLNFDSETMIKKTIFSEENLIKLIFQNILEVSLNSTDIGTISIKICHPDFELVSQQIPDVPESATEKSYFMLTVSDTGAGIIENELSVIFEPYAQLDKPNKKNIVKSISLASVKNLVRYLKGNVWVESEPMQGTTYNVIIPTEKFI